MKLFRRTPTVTNVAEPDEIAAPLNDVQREVLAALQTDGIAILPFDRLIGDGSLWSDLTSDIDSWAAAAAEKVQGRSEPPTEKDDYLIRRYRGGKAAADKPDRDALFGPQSPWLRVALDQGLLDVVNTYRGRATKLIDLDHWYTVPFGADYGRVQSQRWHRDPEDQHVVKVFTYFSDVVPDAGPFQYVRGSAEGARYGSLWPWGETDWYPPQEEFEEKIPQHEHVSAEGPRGTMIVCDTSGFHRGGFARTLPRIMSYHTFVSPQSAQQRKFLVDWSDTDDLSDRVRFALA